ncbi:MAG: hypothetical protein JNJ58_04470 [Chitinophagaceae bacterium]|nr:hypothetical protein [Chitinophagaceae bacterium]
MRNAFFYFIMFLFLSGCDSAEKNKQIISLQDSLNEVRTLLDSFQKSTPITGGEMDYWQSSSNFYKLKKNGVLNPSVYITDDLSKHPELIPFKPTLGGQMQFGRITLIGEHWAVAHVEDGHIGGQLWFSYTIEGNNQVKWKRLDQVLTE